MSWQKIKGMKEQRGQAVAEMRTILDSAETARRELTGAEQSRFTELQKRCDALANDIERYDSVQMHEARSLGASKPIFGERDLRDYSLLRAIRCKIENRALDGIEKEVSDELATRSGKRPQGFYFPTEIGIERRDLNLTTGSGAKPTFTDAANFIELLRARTVVQELGATILTGLSGDLSIPKQTGTTSAYWVAEGVAPTESNATIGQVALAPKTVGAFTDLSRKFILQSSVSAEQFVRNDLARIVALAIDLAALNGSGSGAEPQGILQNGSVATVALGTNGAAPTWANLVQMETTVATANADLGAMAYVTTAQARGKLKQIEVVEGSGEFIWSRDNTVNGYRAAVTSQMPSNLTKGTAVGVCSSAIFGNFNDLAIGFWSGLDILVDPYTGGTAGNVRVVALQDCDIKLRNSESFVKIVDMLTT